MKLSVLGNGNIGGTVGQAWMNNGHKVMFGVRDPHGPKAVQFLAQNSGAQVGTVSEACQFGDVILLAIPGPAVQEVVKKYQSDLDGKTIIDATNQRGPHDVHNMTFIKENLPQSNQIRAFSNLGWENFADPNFGGEKADLFSVVPQKKNLSSPNSLKRSDSDQFTWAGLIKLPWLTI